MLYILILMLTTSIFADEPDKNEVGGDKEDRNKEDKDKNKKNKKEDKDKENNGIKNKSNEDKIKDLPMFGTLVREPIGLPRNKDSDLEKFLVNHSENRDKKPSVFIADDVFLKEDIKEYSKAIENTKPSLSEDTKNRVRGLNEKKEKAEEYEKLKLIYYNKTKQLQQDISKLKNELKINEENLKYNTNEVLENDNFKFLKLKGIYLLNLYNEIFKLRKKEQALKKDINSKYWFNDNKRKKKERAELLGKITELENEAEKLKNEIEKFKEEFRPIVEKTDRENKLFRDTINSINSIINVKKEEKSKLKDEFKAEYSKVEAFIYTKDEAGTGFNELVKQKHGLAILETINQLCDSAVIEINSYIENLADFFNKNKNKFQVLSSSVSCSDLRNIKVLETFLNNNNDSVAVIVLGNEGMVLNTEDVSKVENSIIVRVSYLEKLEHLAEQYPGRVIFAADFLHHSNIFADTKIEEKNKTQSVLYDKYPNMKKYTIFAPGYIPYVESNKAGLVSGTSFSTSIIAGAILKMYKIGISPVEAVKILLKTGKYEKPDSYLAKKILKLNYFWDVNYCRRESFDFYFDIDKSIFVKNSPEDDSIVYAYKKGGLYGIKSPTILNLHNAINFIAQKKRKEILKNIKNKENDLKELKGNIIAKIYNKNEDSVKNDFIKNFNDYVSRWLQKNSSDLNYEMIFIEFQHYQDKEKEILEQNKFLKEFNEYMKNAENAEKKENIKNISIVSTASAFLNENKKLFGKKNTLKALEKKIDKPRDPKKELEKLNKLRIFYHFNYPANEDIAPNNYAEEYEKKIEKTKQKIEKIENSMSHNDKKIYEKINEHNLKRQDSIENFKNLKQKIEQKNINKNSNMLP